MDGTIMVTIRRPAGMTAAAFLKKMRGDVFPAVHKGPTRVGEVDSWTLLSETPNLPFALQSHFARSVRHNPSGCNTSFRKTAE